MMMSLQLMIVKNKEPVHNYLWPTKPISEFCETTPNVLFAYCLHPSFFTIYKSLRVQSTENARTIINKSFGFTVIVYTIIMLVSLQMFKDDIKSDLLINILESSKDESFAYPSSFLFIFMAALHTPVIFFIGKESLLTIYCELKYRTVSEDKSLDENTDNQRGGILTRHIKNNANISLQLNDKEYYPITIMLYITMVISVIFIKDIGKLFALLGSL